MGNGQIVTTRKRNFQTDIIGKGKDYMNTSSQGQGPSSSTSPDKDGFIPARTRAKGWGQKCAHLDQQVDSGFNHFDIIDNMVIEEGIPIEVQCAATSLEGRNSILSGNQEVVSQQMSETSTSLDSGALVVSPTPHEKDVLLGD